MGEKLALESARLPNAAILDFQFQILEADLLDSLPVGHVTNRRGDDRPLGGRHRAECDFHGELGSILASSEQVESRPHRPRPWSGEESLQVGRMPIAKSLRQQNVDGLAEELRPGIAENSFRLYVDELNESPPIHDHERVGSPLNERPSAPEAS